MSMDFNLTARNIGPLRALSSKQKINSCKIGVFANNGSGKTFLSRMFRLASTGEYEQEQLNNLLTINEKSGHFLFELKSPDEDGRVRKFSVDVTRNMPAPVITNDSGYLFHVFNSDYVRENIEVREYAPDGNVEGYILGKGNIDLSKEKKELALLEETQRALIEELKATIENERGKLNGLGIRKNLGEYKAFCYENFTNDFKVAETLSFSRLTELHNCLKAMPDDLPDVIPMPFLPELPDFVGIKSLLHKAYSRSNLAENFVAKVKEKQAFIEQGLKLNDKSECPFCEQPYSVQASELIGKYNDYLSDEEARVVSQCSAKIKELNSTQGNVEQCVAKAFQSSLDFEKKKKYIPSAQEQVLSNMSLLENFYGSMEALGQLLADKALRIDDVDFEFGNIQRDVESFFTTCESILSENTAKISKFNDQKNNVQVEKRKLDRRLCRALFLETMGSLGTKLRDVSSQRVEIERLRLEIEQREAQVRVEKRKRVANSLTRFLDLFFDGKYRFDEKEFHITFEGVALGQKITSVLSDGEKSIVAFCHYLAETHVHLVREEDYRKLFFIIDDPISSLDFHYVYAVAQVIRKIEDYFDLKGHPRFMVFTHNIEFMSILSRNKIVQQRFVLSGGNISQLNEHLIMPYEAHLRDVHAVARESALPKHTTPNSIRHVLETISRFDAPRAKLEDYFEKCEELQGNEFVYSLMHDGSHGMIRTDKAYTDDMIQRGCEAVVKFIENKFEGQIAHVATP